MQPVLRRIGVLVLVDQQVRAALAPFRRHGGVGGEERDRQRDQVVEIDRLIGAQRLVVASERSRGCRLASSFAPLSRPPPATTSAFFHRLIAACAARARARSVVGDQLGDDRQDVVGIEDRESRA